MCYTVCQGISAQQLFHRLLPPVTVSSHVKGGRHVSGNQVPWVVDLVELPAHREMSWLAPACALARA